MRIILYISLIFTILSCSNDNKIAKKSNVELPSWVISPYIKGKVAAVGIAPPSKGGLQFQIPQSEADARANIAAQIETMVSRLTKEALHSSKLSSMDEEVTSVFSQVTKNLVKKVPIKGARRIALYKDHDGTLYVQMAIDNKMISKYIKEQREIFGQSLEDGKISSDKLIQAEKAVEKLYNELDRELN